MKRLVITSLLIMLCFNLFAQWKVKTIEDDYTLEKNNLVFWENNQQGITAVYFPKTSVIRLVYFFNGEKYFHYSACADQSKGRLKPINVDMGVRVINTDKSFKEITDTYEMFFSEFNEDDFDSFFGYLDIELDADLLKKGSYLTARIKDPFIDTIITMKIPLAGFTAAFNRARK